MKQSQGSMIRWPCAEALLRDADIVPCCESPNLAERTLMLDESRAPNERHTSSSTAERLQDVVTKETGWWLS